MRLSSVADLGRKPNRAPSSRVVMIGLLADDAQMA